MIKIVRNDHMRPTSSFTSLQHANSVLSKHAQVPNSSCRHLSASAPYPSSPSCLATAHPHHQAALTPEAASTHNLDSRTKPRQPDHGYIHPCLIPSGPQDPCARGSPRRLHTQRVRAADVDHLGGRAASPAALLAGGYGRWTMHAHRTRTAAAEMEAQDRDQTSVGTRRQALRGIVCGLAVFHAGIRSRRVVPLATERLLERDFGACRVW